MQTIEPVRDIAGRFGGSHAQRDLLTLTMIEASIQSGDGRRARHYIGERLTHKPTAWSERLLARLGTRAINDYAFKGRCACRCGVSGLHYEIDASPIKARIRSSSASSSRLNSRSCGADDFR